MTINIHSIETLGALDGPGLRTIFFLQGCPLRCKYCHNADMLLPNSSNAKSVDELVEKAKKYKNFYGDEGGVTLSGGEPLMQADGVVTLANALRKEGIHTALDTSGAPFNAKALEAVDMVILDIKHTDTDSYFDLVRYKIDDMLATLDFLVKNKKRFWVRQVIVEGITDSEEQIKALKQMAKGAEKIELLPYHKMGVNKWKAAGLKYAFDNVPSTSAEAMKRVNLLIKKL